MASKTISRDARWYVFYVPPGREPEVFGGKSGWKYPKAVWGPFEERREAVKMANVQAAHDGVRGKSIAKHYRVKRLTNAQYEHAWGTAPDGEYRIVQPWAQTAPLSRYGMTGTDTDNPPRAKRGETGNLRKIATVAGLVGVGAYLVSKYK